MSYYLSQAPSFVLLVFGFGFVVFFHELGHFLAAKWAGVKVEQFAVGFGHALLAWRKGIGLRVGSTTGEYDRRISEHLAKDPENSPESLSSPSFEQLRKASEELGLGETEYRLNWIPLGGYVKMLGQDDLKPNAQSSDPRAYNMKSVGSRMVIVSAGVIMNIILAIIGFTVLFRMGFNAPPPVVGGVMPDSPAATTVREDGSKAPLQVGDRILYLDDKYQHDFTKISLNTALLEEGQSTSMYVLRRDGTKEHLRITPARMEGESKGGFLMLGITQPWELQAPKKRDELPEELRSEKLIPKDSLALKSGDIITEVNGQSVAIKEYYKFDDALQNSLGKPVELTVRGDEGKGEPRKVLVTPRFDRTFGKEPLNFAGMLPRPSVDVVLEFSPARDRILPGDIVAEIVSAGDPKPHPTAREFTEWLDKAGASDKPVDIKVLRGDQIVTIEKIVPSVKVTRDRYGLGIQLGNDDRHAVVAGTMDSSPARAAGIPAGATITAIAGNPVTTWFDVRRELANADAGKPVSVAVKTAAGEEKKFDLSLSADQIADTRSLRIVHSLVLRDMSEPRQTGSAIEAAEWGVVETRDFVLQFYLTMKRMFQGSVSYTNMMGPVGIFHAGTKLAYKGNDWLIWFLSMISANLAVVNFLPIPIVDGGLFTFLILEKIKGKPLSPRAQSIAQVVGLALLLGVFLLVTYQDISRLFWRA